VISSWPAERPPPIACSDAATLGDTLRGQEAAIKQLWLLAYREAQVETFADAYLAIAMCFTVAVVMVPLMHKVAPPKSPSPDAH